jgi:hypothetical protein
MTISTLTEEDQEVQASSSKNLYITTELSKQRAAQLEASYQKHIASSSSLCVR